MKTTSIFAEGVRRELERARRIHPAPMPTAHDAHGKIREECDEFWDEVRKKERRRSRRAMLLELVQIGAMAQRAAEDLGLTTKRRDRR